MGGQVMEKSLTVSIAATVERQPQSKSWRSNSSQSVDRGISIGSTVLVDFYGRGIHGGSYRRSPCYGRLIYSYTSIYRPRISLYGMSYGFPLKSYESMENLDLG